MGLDILLFREQFENGKLVKESQRRRGKGPETVDAVITADGKAKEAKYKLDQANAKRHEIQKRITEKRKTGGSIEELLAEKEANEATIPGLEKDSEELNKIVNDLLSSIGNLVHDSVIVNNNEDFNEIVKTWGETKTGEHYHHHFDVLAMLDAVELARGVKVASHRGYFLRGVGVQLNFAIMNYAMEFLVKKNYTLLQPPYLMRRDVMAKTAQLEQFDEELYKIKLSHKDKPDGQTDDDDERYLIATSEQPISALHQGEWLETKQLPIRYAGVSTCFRKEAGAHGKDVRGIFRVHQFEKIEQFCITGPEESWEMHEAMLAASEEFYQSLGIPYRVVSIVSGALNNAASKKYDLEGWFPSFNEHRELVSCSNCTDYQSRTMDIRYGSKKQGEREKKYVHMLNSTLAATTRTICAIAENYQTAEGVVVPEPLRKYIPNLPEDNILRYVVKYEDLPQSKGTKGKKK
ncbi:hypothetical protein PROFUN_04809 [Planoprotostelium fungivorum]|uniref:serine--tRNA ligase n=1 Tax=Planoprotostelium fungivorum TaxID=1890364 RepID=A0A2P6NSY8_9EUKA|nr:hypothetical protein PROFUN_04809 [Planoprotostelium fungivorum]